MNKPIAIRRGGYQQDGGHLNPHEMIEKLKEAPESKDASQAASNLYTAGALLTLPGAFLVGWEAGFAITGHNADWALGGAGAGLIIIGSIFEFMGDTKLKGAVRAHNEKIKGKGIGSLTAPLPILVCAADRTFAGLKFNF
jgi:hypothetical protein